MKARVVQQCPFLSQFLNLCAPFAARSVDAAISALAAARGEVGPVERHPERRMKSAYAMFEEREMPRLKEENPALRLSQLKNMLQKLWKKSPENPMNQAHVAYNAEAGAVPEA
jgi:Coiled-coil domain-containing protein 124 /Oxs1